MRVDPYLTLRLRRSGLQIFQNLLCVWSNYRKYVQNLLTDWHLLAKGMRELEARDKRSICCEVKTTTLGLEIRADLSSK